MTSKTRKIAIMGCGTAGLASAAFLADAGFDITLFEKFAAPKPVGAGLLLQPTGLACLARLGLDKKAIATGAPIHHLFGRTTKGRVIFDLDYRKLSPALHGLGLHRGALFHLLYQKTASYQVPIITDTEILSTKACGTEMVLSDHKGDEYGPFHLVIDATGKNSGHRPDHLISLQKPYPYGALWGVVSDPGQAFGQNRLAQLYDGAHMMTGMMAIGRDPQTGMEACTFFWSLPPGGYDAWRKNGLQAWQDKVSRYWPELTPFINQFTSLDQLNYAHYGDIIMKRPYQDRLVHIGDAAHHSSPQLGQGANLALMDAFTLSQMLSRHQDIDIALHAYGQLRRRPVRFYQQASRWLTPFFQSDSKSAGWLRDNSFCVLGKMPVISTEMLRILAGIKTGWFSHANPAEIHPDYDLYPASK